MLTTNNNDQTFQLLKTSVLFTPKNQDQQQLIGEAREQRTKEKRRRNVVFKIARYQLNNTTFGLVRDNASGDVSKENYKERTRVSFITNQNVEYSRQQLVNPLQFKESYCERILRKIRHLLKFVFGLLLVWSPDEPKRMAWDIASMTFIFVQMLTIPVIIAFEIEITGGFKQFNDIMDIYFMVDVVLSFQTGYYHKGSLILQRTMIAKNYLQFWFWIDIASSFPYDLVIQQTQSAETQADMQRNAQLLKFIRFLKFIKIIRLLRALKLKKIFAKLEDYLSFGSALNSCISFLKLCVLILCIAHWCACIWYLLVLWQDNPSLTWIAQYNQLDVEWDTKYLSSLYFIITTMITIGYGDIHAYTPPEMLFAILIMILASGVFGYAMNSIMVMFQNQIEQLVDLKEKNTTIVKYMKQKEMQPGLQSRVRNYLEWLADSEQIAKNFQQQMIEGLSANLKTEIISLIQGRIIKSIPLLSKNFSHNLLIKLAFTLTERIQGPEEFVFLASDSELEYGKRCLYYLQNGQVAVVVNQCQLSNLQKGCIFGEIGFFANVARTASIQTLDFVNLMVVSREQFIELCVSSQDRELMYQLKYNIEIEQDFSMLKLNCFCCEKEGHVAKYCPLMHYQINKYERVDMIKRTKEKIIVDIKCKRKMRQKQNSLRLLRNKTFIVHSQRIQRHAAYAICQKRAQAVSVASSSEYSFDLVNESNLQEGMSSASKSKSPKNNKADEFVFEAYKQFSNFQPRNNITTIANEQNENASQKLQEIQQNKLKKIRLLFEAQFKIKAGNIFMGLPKKNNRKTSIVYKAKNILSPSLSKQQQQQEEVQERRRLIDVKEARKRKEDRNLLNKQHNGDNYIQLIQSQTQLQILEMEVGVQTVRQMRIRRMHKQYRKGISKSVNSDDRELINCIQYTIRESAINNFLK